VGAGLRPTPLDDTRSMGEEKGRYHQAVLSYSQGALRTQRSTSIREGSLCKGITMLQDFLSVAAFLRQIQFAFGFGGG